MVCWESHLGGPTSATTWARSASATVIFGAVPVAGEIPEDSDIFSEKQGSLVTGALATAESHADGHPSGAPYAPTLPRCEPWRLQNPSLRSLLRPTCWLEPKPAAEVVEPTMEGVGARLESFRDRCAVAALPKVLSKRMEPVVH